MKETFMINQLMTQLNNMMKSEISTEQGDDYTTGWVLNFAYFEKKLQINCSRFK